MGESTTIVVCCDAGRERWTRRRKAIWLTTAALVPFLLPPRLQAADLTISSDISTGLNLDVQSGTTAEILSGVSLSNAPFGTAINATTSVWSLTNRGAISSSYANTISLSAAGSSVTNYSSITAGSVSNAIVLTGGGSVENEQGATISSGLSAIIIGKSSPAGGAGTVTNAGTIRQTGTSGDLVSLRFGGTVTNLAGATISASNSSNAVSVGQGAARTVVNSGTIENTGTGYATGVLVQGGASTVTNNATGHISGTFNGVYASSSAPLTLTNDGTIESTGSKANAYAVEADGGGTLVNTGTITSASSDGLYAARAATVTNSGTISGAVRAITFSGNFAHTLNLDTGSVLNGVVQGGAGVDSLVLLGSGTEDAAKFLSFETVSMQGTAWQLTGAGTFATSAEAKSGTLTVAGTLTSPTISILPTATLTGNGTLIGAVSNSGTMLASSGTLSVTGSYTGQAGSILAVGVTPATSGTLAISGTATLNGGTVKVLAGAGAYAPSTSYTILTASDGVSGTFSGVTSSFAFLTPSLSYGNDDVYLTLVRNGIDFDSVGGTPNQREAGHAVELLGAGNVIYDAVEQLDIPGARAAFDQLSGEVHASIRGMLLEDSRFVREAVTNRMLIAFDDSGEAQTPVMGYGEGGTAIIAPDNDRVAFWTQTFGSWGRMAGDGNAAGFDRSTGGLLVGADSRVGDWRLGMVGGYSHATLDAAERQSHGDSENLHLGLYGGTQWDSLALHAGLAYTWHDLSTGRRIAFNGFDDALSAGYRAGTAQVFGELAYKVRSGPLAFEPFANFAYTSVHTDGFAETGGAAALTAAASNMDTTFVTLGLRAGGGFTLDGLKAAAYGTLGWRHVLGDTTPMSALTFAGGDTFEIAGTPIARDTAVVEADFDLALGDRSKLGVGYSGYFGNGLNNNALDAKLSLTF